MGHCGEPITHRPHADCTGIAPKPRSQHGPSRLEVLGWFDSVRLSQEQAVTVEELREGFKVLAIHIMETVPACPDRTTALRALHAASQQAVFAFSHNIDREPFSA